MKLHLGCGKRFIPGFVHVDQCTYAHIDHCRDVGSLDFLDDACAELIYASHVLEYFDGIEAIEVLSEWKRVLRPGGLLRLAVPDFAKLCELYSEGLPLAKILGPLFGRMQNGTAAFTYHKTVYDFSSLTSVLQTVGFSNIRHYDWRSTLHKDYDDFSQAYIPHMDKENGTLISLNVEATKGV